MRAVAGSGHGGAVANTPGRAVGASAGRLADAARSAACRRPSLASPRDPPPRPSPPRGLGVFAATSHQHGLLRRPCGFFPGGPRFSAPRAGLQGVRAEAPCAAGADAGRCGPARRLLPSPPHAGPHRLRAASRIASAPPCSPFACARFASSRVPCARQRTAERGARSHAHGKSAGGPGRRSFACTNRGGARDRAPCNPTPEPPQKPTPRTPRTPREINSRYRRAIKSPDGGTGTSTTSDE